MDLSGAPTPPKMEFIDTKPAAPKRKRTSTIDLEDDRPDDVENHHNPGSVRVENQRNPGSVMKRLPLSANSYLQHKPKGEILYNKKDHGADLVLSKQNHDEVNFYAAHPERLGPSFVGLIEPTDEMLAALARTIKGEVGVADGTTRVVFDFTVVGLDNPKVGSGMAATTLNTASHPAVMNPSSSKHGPFSFLYPPAGKPKSTPDHVSQAQGAFSPTGIIRPLSSSHTIDSSPLNRLIRLRHPHEFGADGSDGRASKTGPNLNQASQLALPRGQLQVNSPAQRQSTKPDPERRVSAIRHAIQDGSSLLRAGNSERLVLSRLQSQWPYDTKPNPTLSALGCFAIVYRNIFRHLPRTEGLETDVFSLGTLFEGVERRLWDYLWQDMNPKEAAADKAFRIETQQLIDELIGLFGLDCKGFTFKQLAEDHRILESLWNHECLHLYQPDSCYKYSIDGNTWSDWEKVPCNPATRIQGIIEWNGHGDLINQVSAPFVTKYHPRAFTPERIKDSCAMPAVIPVLLKIAPNQVPIANLFEAVGQFELRDWDARGGPPLDGTPLGMLKGRYQLMAVVRLRKTIDELDMVRVYSWSKKCVVPDHKTFLYPAQWGISEAGREYMLYYSKVEDWSISPWAEEVRISW